MDSVELKGVIIFLSSVTVIASFLCNHIPTIQMLAVHLKLLLSLCVCQFVPWCQFTIALGYSNIYFNAKLSLVNKLTNNSSIMKEILPVVGTASPVKLRIDVALRQIAALDEVNQAIRLMVWLRLYWNNPFLRWEPKQYQGIKAVHVDSDLFWKPDIALFNQASLEEDIEILYKRLSTKLIISYDGNCTWYAPVTIFSTCKIIVSRFPFDEQECLVIFGSWTHSQKEIDVVYENEKVDLKKFIVNGEWKILDALLKNNTRYYGPKKDLIFPDVTFHLRIKRRPLYYAINLIVPCSLIALLSFFSFFLPSDHGERVSLVITVLLANSVYMLIVSSSLPQTSDGVPLIGIYFLGIVVEIALCLVATCLIMKIRAKESKMPKWIETLVNEWIARFVFVKPDESTDHTRKNRYLAAIADESFNNRTEGRRQLTSQTANGCDSKRKNTESRLQDMEFIETKILLSDTAEDSSEDHRGSLLGEIRLLADEVRARQKEELLLKKWKRAAKVLDRFFIFIFLLIYFSLTAYLVSSM